MISPPNDKLIDALISGLSRPEAPQDPKGKPGDPQLAALCQLLVQTRLSETNIIVDFGAGRGLLAEYLSTVWPSDQQVPQYWAVDVPDSLDQLQLNCRVHNVSKKYPVEEFYSVVLPRDSARIALVVIRNTLHELPLKDTARLFGTLRRHLPEGATIYIQDMVRPARAERGNVGWERLLLEEALGDLGFHAKGFELMSHGGTPWFVIVCTQTPPADVSDVLERRSV